MFIWLMILALVLVLYALFEYTWYRRVTLTMADFTDKTIRTKRIVFLSDFQFDHRWMGFRHYAVKKLFANVSSLNPDLIIIGGDIIHKKNRYAHLIFSYLEQLECEKVAVLGNHDYYDLDLVLKEYNTLGVRVLRNEIYVYDDIQIVGLDHPTKAPVFVPKLRPELFTVLISHGPDYCVDENVSADIILAGHLHGGQITLFGLFAPITNSKYKQKYLHGLKRLEGRPMYVSSGLGGYVGFLPIRFFARPEIVILDF